MKKPYTKPHLQTDSMTIDILHGIVCYPKAFRSLSAKPDQWWCMCVARHCSSTCAPKYIVEDDQSSGLVVCPPLDETGPQLCP